MFYHQPADDAETRSRFVLVSVDESPEQTRAILQARRQSHTLEGLRRAKERERVHRRHHAFQRLLKPLRVVNPFEPLLRLTWFWPKATAAWRIRNQDLRVGLLMIRFRELSSRGQRHQQRETCHRGYDGRQEDAQFGAVNQGLVERQVGNE